ncbi:MAG: ThiF family adenylyltransferase [Thermomicrobiales bacterium]
MTDNDFRARLEETTLAYQPEFRADDRPVVVSLPENSETPGGDALLCSLVNQLARIHRRLVLVGNLTRPVLCRDPFGATTLLDATAGNAASINPAIEIDVVERPPASKCLTHLSIGGPGDLSLGFSGWTARAGKRVSVTEDDSDIWGALLASTLGAWFAFRRQLGKSTQIEGDFSLWAYGRQSALGGPHLSTMPPGGRTLQVGAGGVGAALDYWLAMLGYTGALTVADGDVVEVGNLNRQLIFNASDAGYPSGTAGNKASIAASRLGPSTNASPHWYGDDGTIVEADYDVILALANEHGAREALQDRRPPVLLHATTSPNYQAQLHRHLPNGDDCIRCRLPGPVAQTACATAPIPAANSDAALPFLSGLAGLLLVPALVRCALGQVTDDSTNLDIVDLSGGFPGHQHLRMQCKDGCAKRRTA